MFLYILKWIIIYIILISLFHYLFNFFQKTLTTNKSKDILNYSNIQYSKINNLLNNNNNNQNNQNNKNLENNQNNKNLEKNIEDELNDFLNKLNTNK